MIQVGKIYTSVSGERFLILAKKKRPASNGCNYIGENTKTGLVTYFNHKGEHAVSKDWELQTDPYKWIGLEGSRVSKPNFRMKDEMELAYEGYLRIEDDNPATIVFITRAGFESTYAA
jgi:hypothetical protein